MQAFKPPKPSPSLIALKPRQVVLSSTMKKTQEASAPSLTPHQKSLLFLSVAQFLQRNSFSKTLKKFLSEASIQKDDLTGSSLDLEEMCCKYLAISESEDDKSAKSKKIEEQVLQEAAKESATVVTDGLQLNEPAKKEKEKKKKKNKLDESHVDTVECNPSESLGGESESKPKQTLSTEANGGSDAGVEDKTKDKKKKKNKPTSDALVGNATDIPVEDKTSKSKKKKKKDDSKDVEKEKSKDDENRTSKVDSTSTDDKGSKKRKRLDSEAHDSQHVNENATEDSKRRKTETTEEQLNSLAGADKQLHEQENGNIVENGKHSEQKSLKKKQNGSSAQPKKPFQRVNLEEVVFVDSRLEDNSYWAKDGAETGYGAKAQEVLGQVRGRDFRHEKTKKKRGSYRGGQIDFSSHSVKFNYSDEE